MTEPESQATAYGPNVWLIEEMYDRFRTDPESVGEAWRDFLSDYKPLREAGPNGGGTGSPAPAVTPSEAALPAAVVPAPAPAPAPTPAPGPSALPEGAEPLRGAAARIVQNMEASLGVPTATSVRTIPVKILEENRREINRHLAQTRGGKISFTHLIAWAMLRAAARVPAMNASYAEVDGKPHIVRNPHVNLGLAVDMKRKDGTRTLLVPNIKAAETLDFAAFMATYDDLLRRVHAGKVDPAEFDGTTLTLTNPGTIGTMHSVPRLMEGRGAIIASGAIDYPPEYQAADPDTIAQLGVSKILTLTSTYDHRIIQGAESGEYLAAMHRCLLGEDGFYDTVFRSLRIPHEPVRWSQDSNPRYGSDPEEAREKQAGVLSLVNMFRVRGHLLAELNPLGTVTPTHPELDPANHGLSVWDFDRTYYAGGLAGRRTASLRDILDVVRDAYTRTVGIEYMHIQDPEQKRWIQERVEGVSTALPVELQRHILGRLNAAEAFERFLHTKYVGHKRFSLEGAESLIPMLDVLLDEAADAHMEEVVLGMAHRGRLNVLANVIGKSYEKIFREFEGDLDPGSTQGSGDVKYHLGASGKHTARSGASLALTLASNPSHLEAVDPVVEGLARAKQDMLDDAKGAQVMSVLVHGDAAFAGQGVVAETLNLSGLPGYRTGGTVHIVVNNQVGFTTGAELARSSFYATDVAKMVQAPIFHVNGDDPEACVRVISLAFAYRQAFSHDVVVEMVCYRRHGHNENDEPAYTQPRMYRAIEARRSVRKLYTEALVTRGDLTMEEVEHALEEFRRILEAAFEETRGSEPPSVLRTRPQPQPTIEVNTAVDREVLERVLTAVTTFPETVHPHPRLARILASRANALDGAPRIDWALGETFAFGSLVLEGTPVRLAGQDSCRGTFSQRHGVVVDQETGTAHTPLANLDPGQAPFMAYDSLLSEYAAVGFEYGYSVARPEALVCWEAQFGDFANGAQIIIDNFIVAAEDKWGQHSGVVLLLPHGYEGQGPEHSSARIERFLVLCAQGNIRVAQPTTAAQYFHLLRLQARGTRRPLIVLTPKVLLRMAESRSTASDFTGGAFRTVLEVGDVADPAAVTRVLLCTGRIAYDLDKRRVAEGRQDTAVVRFEQLYPAPMEAAADTLSRYPNVASVAWVQDEPRNMGAWPFLKELLLLKFGDKLRGVVSRPTSPAPATGSLKVHELEQERLLQEAFA